MKRPLARILLPLAILAALPAIAAARRPSTHAEPLSISHPAAADTTPPPAPFALSDPDGHELVLERLDVRAAVHGMLALTEVELRFRNPRERRMEGRFSAVLPEGATVSRFAKEVAGHLVEGEVVERQRAHRVYDEIVHQMRDPAMLDQEAGNRFSARVFPIEAGATVRLVLAYTTLLRQSGGERAYTLPLRGMPRVGVFTFHGSFAALAGETGRQATFVQAAGPGRVREAGRVWTIDRSDESFVPQQDLQVAWRAEPNAAPSAVLAAGEFYVAAFRPAVPAARAAGPGRWIFYLDTSASGADGAEHRVRAVERLLAALPAGDEVEVRAFDHRVTRLAAGTAAQVARQVGAALRERRYLGGTDLGAVLRDAAAAARARPGAAIVVQTDGVGTLGTVDPALLRAAVDSVPAGAVLHALVLGARQDEATLRMLTAGRGRVVSIPFTDSLDARARDAARRLALPPGATFSAADPGAEWVYATGGEDVQPGDEVLVMARLKPGARPAPRLAGRGGVMAAAAAEPLAAGSFGPLLEREAYRAYIRDLNERASRTMDDSLRAALAEEEVSVSVAHRVLSPRTTLLVLETEQDYARFGLDRRALAEILAVGPEGIIRVDRDPAALAALPAAPAVNRPAEVPRSAAASNARPAAGAPEREALALSEVVVTGAGTVRDVGGGSDADAASAGDDRAESSGGAPMPMAPQPAPLPPPPPPSPVEAQGPVAAPARVPEVMPPAGDAPVRQSGDRDLRRSNAAVQGRAATPPGVRASAPAWTRPEPASRGRVDSLRAQLAAAPRDREVRNQLAEALWARREWQALRELALEWQPYDPENPQVYEALGEASVNLGRRDEAERALGSLVEVADGKPELLQRAGLLLLRVNAARLAETPLRRALAQRPDRVNGYRHLALMLWQDGREEEAARVLEDATRRTFPGWYGNAQRVVHEELGYVLRAWMARQPARRAQIRGEAAEYGVDLDRRDALRVTMAWEADANDVDLHVVDPAGEECYYAHKETAQGLELYEDITQGFGPEVVRADKLVPGTYHVGVTYFSAGAMGVSRGVLVMMRPDARSGVPAVQILPFRLVEGDPSEVRHVLSFDVAAR